MDLQLILTLQQQVRSAHASGKQAMTAVSPSTDQDEPSDDGDRAGATSHPSQRSRPLFEKNQKEMIDAWQIGARQPTSGAGLSAAIS